MHASTENGSALRITVGLACLVIIIAGMKAAADIVVPFLLSAFIAILCTPMVKALRDRRFPMWLALATVVGGIGIAGTLVISIIGNSIHNFSLQLPAYQEQLQNQVNQLFAWLNTHGIDWYSDELRQYINPNAALVFVGRVFNGLGSVLASSFLIFLTVMFLLFEGISIKGKLQQISVDDSDDPSQELAAFLRSVNQYMLIKSITSLGTGALIAVWVWMLDVEYALLWGLLAFLLNFIPNVGSIIAAIPAVLLALISGSPVIAFWVITGYLLINTLIGNIIEPKFLGDHLGLSPLVVFLSLVFWGWVLGTTGMFLSVPLTMVVKLALEARPETRWIAILLGTGKPPAPEH
jgi:predicted PurR-regulated permease PerM